MKHYDERIIELIHLQLCDKLTEPQEEELQSWLDRDASHHQLWEEIRTGLISPDRFELFNKIDNAQAWRNVVRKACIPNKHKLYIRTLQRIAAVILLLLSIGGGYLLFHSLRHPETVVYPSFSEIKPGKIKATLYLANHTRIQLDDQKVDQVKIAEGVHAQRDPAGIIYPEQTNSSQMEENILQIPRGGEYKITLSDGTVVYLNSGSELRYPVAFQTDHRDVYLSGEGYFQVAKDTSRPFLVHVSDLSIRVYGTSFNINTYKEGLIQTVLVEGKIGIQTLSSGEYQLKPGQLASYDLNGKSLDIRNVDTYPYIAWKDNVFVFENKSLEEIMNILSLWYDIEIFFQNSALKYLHFTGNLGRYENIDTILNAISNVTPVKFSVRGKSIVVSE